MRGKSTTSQYTVCPTTYVPAGNGGGGGLENEKWKCYAVLCLETTEQQSYFYVCPRAECVLERRRPPGL